ncbi:unnamed protein product [Victoria cruziana]
MWKRNGRRLSRVNLYAASSPLRMLDLRLFPAYFLATIFFLLLGFSHSLSPDGVALLGFKESITGDPSKLLSGWNSADESPCSWYGVSCDGDSGRVTALNVTGPSWPAGRFSFLLPPDSRDNSSVLAGTLSASIGNLTALQALSLPWNAFSGRIPEEIGGLRVLEVLELQGNSFSGSIPDQISGIPYLRVLNLAYNSLSGEIPARIVQCARLRWLNLEGNFLNGSMPDGLIGFSGLESIDLSYNQLSGKIAREHFGQCGSLQRLHLSCNSFISSIPREVGNCSKLRSLILSGNVFEGAIPPQLGLLSELRILDVSRNSLTGRIPRELANCRNLSVLVLTKLVDISSFSSGLSDYSLSSSFREEFNAFDGGIPYEIFVLPNLKIFWAPRANLNGRLPYYWSTSCQLWILNLGLNYIDGVIPDELSFCKNLTLLDLSSNSLRGKLPARLPVKCMVYFNVSRNSLSGSVFEFEGKSCSGTIETPSVVSDGRHIDSVSSEKLDQILEYMYSVLLSDSVNLTNPFYSFSTNSSVILHDLSRNNFIGPMNFSSIGDELLVGRPSYGLLLNNNQFSGYLPFSINSTCQPLEGFVLDVSFNQISGAIPWGFFRSCPQMVDFMAAYNQLNGPIPTDISSLSSLSNLNLTRNHLNGTIPDQLVNLKSLRTVLLGENSLAGEIPAQLGQSSSLMVLDLSHNSVTGAIPESLGNASNLRILLLDHNSLSGEIPSSFSGLANLIELDVSYNNLSGYVPALQYQINCDSFRGNTYLHRCTNHSSPTPIEPPAIPPVKRGLHPIMGTGAIIAVASSSAIVLTLLVLLLILYCGRKGYIKLSNQKRRLVVTFTSNSVGLDYENVVRATGNFSITNLIGTGGFGSTYKAELAPGFLVAVKRLSFGKFQGLKQFDAEIRTLGRIRHENLVTLIGYHMGEKETFLIYNYLPGGNLDSFIHKRSKKNLRWPLIRKIAVDIANALVYLHYDCVPRIVHRDVKPSNILLDNELNAYLSDFGLARLLEVSETHATTDVAGTFGYVAPEYATTCRVSDKADVYSFGVVLLEMLSGKRSLDPSFSEYGNGFNIVAWGNMLLKEERPSEFFCQGLWETGPQQKLMGMLKVANMCTIEMLTLRPSMKQVLEKLRQL